MKQAVFRAACFFGNTMKSLLCETEKKLQLQICNSAHKRLFICYNGIVSKRADENE